MKRIIGEQPSALPPLTKKDVREVRKDFDKVFSTYPMVGNDNLSDLDEESMRLLKKSYWQTMLYAKRVAKKKFTPKKYRHGDYWDKQESDK